MGHRVRSQCVWSVMLSKCSFVFFRVQSKLSRRVLELELVVFVGVPVGLRLGFAGVEADHVVDT